MAAGSNFWSTMLFSWFTLSPFSPRPSWARRFPWFLPGDTVWLPRRQFCPSPPKGGVGHAHLALGASVAVHGPGQQNVDAFGLGRLERGRPRWLPLAGGLGGPSRLSNSPYMGPETRPWQRDQAALTREKSATSSKRRLALFRRATLAFLRSGSGSSTRTLSKKWSTGCLRVAMRSRRPG